jgi:hypothetical protein
MAGLMNQNPARFARGEWRMEITDVQGLVLATLIFRALDASSFGPA